LVATEQIEENQGVIPIMREYSVVAKYQKADIQLEQEDMVCNHMI
jgi:hypothetical protein